MPDALTEAFMKATTSAHASHAPVSFSSGAAAAYQASGGGSRRPSGGGSETRNSARASPQVSGPAFATSKPPLRGQGDPPPPPSQSGRPPQGSVRYEARGDSPRSQTGGSRRGSGTGTPLQIGAREQMVRTQESGRDAPQTSMSGRSQTSSFTEGWRNMSTACGETGIAANVGVEDQLPPRRTLRRMYEDPSHHKKDEFLYGLESAPATFKPESSTRNTIFHTGFYRGIVKGQDAVRKHHEEDREFRSTQRYEPRNNVLSVKTKHHFLREDPPQQPAGRRHFEERSNIVIRGPESVVPRGPNMEGHRMKGLLAEGLVIRPKESVKDVFSHMFGYSVQDVYKPLDRGLNGGTPSYTQSAFTPSFNSHSQRADASKENPLVHG